MSQIVWRFWLIHHVRPLELMRQVGLFMKAVVVESGFCFSYYIHSMWKGILKADIITRRFQVWHLLPVIPLLLLIPDRDHCWLWVIHFEEFEGCNKHLSYGEVNFLHQKSGVLVNWYAPFPLHDSWFIYANKTELVKLIILQLSIMSCQLQAVCTSLAFGSKDLYYYTLI